MASRVNTKLVVALIAGVLGLCVAGIGLYAFVLNRGPEDNIRDGDKLMAAGDAEKARLAYGRAVHKDPTNVEYLEKWRSAIVAWKPRTETDYDNEFRNAWIPMLRALAMAQPENLDAVREYLDLQYRLAEMSGMPRESVTYLDSETKSLMAAMDMTKTEDRQVILRYRGMAFATMLQQEKLVSDQERKQAEADLRASLDVDPEDGEASAALMRVIQASANDELKAGRWSQYVKLMDEAVKPLNDHLQIDPDDPEVLVNALALEIDRALSTAARGKVGAEATAAREQARASFEGRPAELAEQLLASNEPMDVNLISRFGSIEAVVRGDRQGPETMRLAEHALQSDPSNASLMMLKAAILSDRGDVVEAGQTLHELLALEQKPVGLAGMVQKHLQRSAYDRLAVTELQKFQQLEASDTAGRAAVLKQAQSYRDEYAKRVQAGDLELLFLDAKLDEANGRDREALTKLQRYNQYLETQAKSSSDRVDALWLQGQVAAKLGEYGRARDSFKAVVDMQPTSVPALVALAGAELELQHPEEALKQYQAAQNLVPGNATVSERIRSLRVQLGMQSSDDPVEQALADAGQALRGTTEAPGDPQKAIEILDKAIKDNGPSPRLATQLASLLLDAGDLERAREVIGLSASANPDNEQLNRVQTALQADSVTDATIALIDASGASDIAKLVNKRAVYERAGQAERAQQMLDEAARIAPNDPMVIELRFSNALAKKKLDEARAIYEKAGKDGLLPYDGLVYRARVEAVEGKHQQAVNTLQQAIDMGANEAPVYRLLGGELVEVGLSQKALDAFKKALKIQPNDISNAKPLIELLIRLGRTDDALAQARDVERYGRNDSTFMNAWLSLEARAGGEEGLARAVTVRKHLSEIRPEDRQNRIELASLYMDLGMGSGMTADQSRQENWAKAKKLIDELKAEKADLSTTQLEARWLADQGQVPQPDGTTIDGIDAARGVFIEYIVNQGADVTVQPYIALAQFMTARGRYDVAEKALQDAREYQTEAYEADKVLGLMYLQLAKFEAAGSEFKTIVEAGADDADSSFRLRWIEMMLRQGQYEEAQAQLNTLDKSQMEGLTVLLQRAEAADGLGKKDEAARLLDRAVALYPQNSLPYTRRAEFRLRDPAMLNDVLADLQQAISLNPNDTQTLRLRAGVYGQAERYDEMLRDLTAALRVDPTLTDVLQAIMVEYLMRGQDGRAMDVVEETIRKRPRDLTLLARAGRTFDERQAWTRSAPLYLRGWQLSGDYNFGLAYINALVSQDPPVIPQAEQVLRQIRNLSGNAQKDWQVDFAGAAILYKKGQTQQAEQAVLSLFQRLASSQEQLMRWWQNVQALYQKDHAACNKLLTVLANGVEKDTPQYAWAKFFLAQSLANDASTRAQAYPIYKDLEALGESSPFARLAYRQEGSALYMEKRFEDAVKVWTDGLKVFPGDWEMCNNAGFALASDLKRPADALAYAKSAVAAAPEQAEAYDTLARAYVGVGELDKAEETLTQGRQYVTSKRSDVSISITQAELDLKRDQKTRARRTLERLLLGIGAMPDLREEFEPDIKRLLRTIDSAGG